MWPLLWGVCTAFITRKETEQLMGSLKRISQDLNVVVQLLDKHLPSMTIEARTAKHTRSAQDSPEYQREMNKARQLADKLAEKVGEKPEKRQEEINAEKKAKDPIYPHPPIEIDDFDDDDDHPNNKPPEFWSPEMLARMAVLQTWFEYGPVWYLYYLLLLIFDIIIWTSLQVFLESIGKKKRKKKPKRARSRSTTPVQEQKPTGRLAILTQEDALARILEEYAGKVIIGVIISISYRIPDYLLGEHSLILQILSNLVITLRGLAATTIFIRDDVAL